MIPEGVREVVGQRVNRLSERCNEVLMTASIIGREFDFELMDALSDDISEDLLGQVIDEAVDAHMLEEVAGSGERYRFSHALVQETLSEELPARRRVRLHGRIAETLEEIYGSGAEAHAAELAHHCAEAGAVLGTEKLVHYSLLAGEQALAAYGWEEALSHFERALVATGATGTDTGPVRDADTAALLFGLGRAQAATLLRNQMQEAIDTLSRAFEYYETIGDVESAVAVAETPIVGFGFGHRTRIRQWLLLPRTPNRGHTQQSSQTHNRIWIHSTGFAYSRENYGYTAESRNRRIRHRHDSIVPSRSSYSRFPRQSRSGSASDSSW